MHLQTWKEGETKIKHVFTEKQIENVWFMLENKLPMTQLIFDTIMDGIMGLGDEVELLILRMIEEYPEFAAIYEKRIDEEVAKANISPMSEEMSERILQGIYAKIREQLGEDAI